MTEKDIQVYRTGFKSIFLFFLDLVIVDRNFPSVNSDNERPDNLVKSIFRFVTNQLSYLL